MGNTKKSDEKSTISMGFVLANSLGFLLLMWLCVYALQLLAYSPRFYKSISQENFIAIKEGSWSLIFFVFFTTPVLVITCLILNARSKLTKLPTALLTYTLTFVIFIIPIGMSTKSTRHEAYKETVAKLQPLIGAIEKYQKDNGRYPASLKALVPKYLAELPLLGGKREVSISAQTELQ